MTVIGGPPNEMGASKLTGVVYRSLTVKVRVGAGIVAADAGA